MMRTLRLLVAKVTDAILRVPAFLEQPWRAMKLNAEEIAERRRNRLDGERNFLWCWQHRGFW